MLESTSEHHQIRVQKDGNHILSYLPHLQNAKSLVENADVLRRLKDEADLDQNYDDGGFLISSYERDIQRDSEEMDDTEIGTVIGVFKG